MKYPEKQQYTIEDLVRVVRILRNPDGGCPWDSTQTHQSVRKNLIEEAYEVAEAIDCESSEMLCEELGDLQLQILLHCAMEEEAGTFDFDSVCDGITRKLIFRHPRIFEQQSGRETLNWEELKALEKSRTTLSDELTSVPVTLPALMKAQKVQKRCEKFEAEKGSAPAAAEAFLQDAGAVRSLDAQTAGRLLYELTDCIRLSGLDAEEVLARYTRQLILQKCADGQTNP